MRLGLPQSSWRLHYWLAKNSFRPSHGERLHRWDDIVDIAEVALLQACVTFGPVVYEQRPGVPIGRLMYKQCASIFLGLCEDDWLTRGRPTHWCPPGFKFEHVAAATWYVDDLAMVSSVLCSSCLEAMVSQIYDKPVQFEAAKPTQLATPWLDVWLMREGLDLRVHAHGAEHAWRSQALHGTVGRPTKFRLMPCQGVDLIDITYLKGILNGGWNDRASWHSQYRHPPRENSLTRAKWSPRPSKECVQEWRQLLGLLSKVLPTL